MSKPDITPEVGMAATHGYGSDCYPYTVVEIRSPKTIVIQSDTATPAPGHDHFGTQSYTYERNPKGEKRVFTQRKNGGWYEKGSPMGYGRLGLGSRRKYLDPHF